MAIAGTRKIARDRADQSTETTFFCGTARKSWRGGIVSGSIETTKPWSAPNPFCKPPGLWLPAGLFVPVGHLAMAVGMNMFVKMDFFIQTDMAAFQGVGLVGGVGEKARIVGNENIA